MTILLTKVFFAVLGIMACLAVIVNGQPRYEKSTFAGGCFWCMEPPFEKLEGVIDVATGYTGGSGENPTYQNYGQKGHIEAIEITYDPSRISYPKLLEVFWRQIDPTDPGGQFVDRGPYYRTAIFHHNEEQKRLAERSKQELGKSGKYQKPIVTEIIPASTFYRAEEYHQDYHSKNPVQYKLYRWKSGRDRYLDRIWGGDANGPDRAERAGRYTKLSREGIRKRLTRLQYEVTQENGTEPAFKNEYWNNKRPGIYVDIVSGEPLFSSLDKFDSGTGWPSFSGLLEQGSIVEKPDRGLLVTRTEVRSRNAGSHLGHVFSDGPKPTGLRYCINSAALRFVPKEDLEKEGYGRYKKLFQE